MHLWKKRFGCQQPMTPERRRVVAISGGVASLGGVSATLAHGHPYAHLAIIAIMLAGLVYVGTLLARSKCRGN